MDEYSNEDYKQRSSMAFPFWSWKDNLKLSSKLSGKGRQNFQAKEDRDFWRAPSSQANGAMEVKHGQKPSR